MGEFNIADHVGKIIVTLVTTGLLGLFSYFGKIGAWSKDHRRARFLEEQGAKFFEKGMYQLAVDHYNDAKKIWEAEVNQAKMLVIYNHIGQAYSRLGDSEKALEALTHCEMIWDALKKDVKIYDVYYGLAQIYLKKQDMERASAYVVLAINMLRADKSPRLPIALSLAARIAKERGRPEEAENSYVEAIKVLDSIGDTFGLASVYYELGDLKCSQQRVDLASNYYTLSASAYGQLGSARADEIRTKLEKMQAAKCA
jgi:tetratricopeptide (TPR) repeat protein